MTFGSRPPPSPMAPHTTIRVLGWTPILPRRRSQVLLRGEVLRPSPYILRRALIPTTASLQGRCKRSRLLRRQTTQPTRRRTTRPLEQLHPGHRAAARRHSRTNNHNSTSSLNRNSTSSLNHNNNSSSSRRLSSLPKFPNPRIWAPVMPASIDLPLRPQTRPREPAGARLRLLRRPS